MYVHCVSCQTVPAVTAPTAAGTKRTRVFGTKMYKNANSTHTTAQLASAIAPSTA